MILAIDFDNTLFLTDYPLIIKPIKKTIEFCKNARKNGHKLILWTCREGKELQEAVTACAECGLAFDAINDNTEDRKAEWHNNPRKVFADFYIDDHNCDMDYFFRSVEDEN